jgi:uncharacterized protein (TIGR03118 family)
MQRTTVRVLFDRLESRLLMSAKTLFNRVNLVSDDASVAASQHDANLVNAWGLAFRPGGPWWVADNGTGKSTLYDGSGNRQSLVVNVPGGGSSSGSAPTGLVFNGTTDFKVAGSPSTFIFDTEDGAVSGWTDGDNAIRTADFSSSRAVFKGLATGSFNGRNLLFATDFHNNRIVVLDTDFHETAVGGTFRDKEIPKGFAPFGIQNIGGQLFVTYAKQDKAAHDDSPGVGNGFVDVYSTNGVLQRRFARRGLLNSPWGIAKAPGGFGKFKHDILIGNFGDGLINVYDPTTGAHRGVFRRTNGKPLHVDGLWALQFGNDSQAGDRHELFFTAGPNEESHGQFGKLTVATTATTAAKDPGPVYSPPGMVNPMGMIMFGQRADLAGDGSIIS